MLNSDDQPTYQRAPLGQEHIFYGGDYNPEQWPAETWLDDMRLMKEAGVNFITLGVFAWAKLEPRRGEYDFNWFDQIMDLLHQNGVQICLATATASPPPWLAKYDPGSLPVTADGVTLFPGGRQHYCPHSPAYRESAAALVNLMAARYANHPALKLWHINNEYACHISECFCDRSASAFRTWLKKRYGSLEALNHAWGTSFWSQQYADWDEIQPPRRAPSFSNPTQQLDWKRFSSDSLLELFEMEKAILRKFTPKIPVTTNFISGWKALDLWKWAGREDIVSLDCYPDPGDPQTFEIALSSDLTRSLGGGRPWILMEQSPSTVNWRDQNSPKLPGQMRLWSYQALARGANAILFFQWRASQAGAEKFHGAIVPHGGTQGSRVWREITQLGAELKKLDGLMPSQVQAECAILLDWENWWALELDSKPSTNLRMREQLFAFYAPLYDANLTTDFVGPGADLSRYKLVVIPNLYLVRAADAENIVRFVENGGTLVMSFFSGIVDENEHIWLGGYPAPFRAMLGLRVEEFAPHSAGEKRSVRWNDGTGFTCDLWSDVVDLEGAQALATFTSGFTADKPAITRHSFGKGSAYYLATRLEARAMQALFAKINAEAKVNPAFSAPCGVEVVRRKDHTGEILFFLNHLAEPVLVEMGSVQGVDMLTGAPVQLQLHLDPFGVSIVRI
jgi:beta-galactosidase